MGGYDSSRGDVTRGLLPQRCMNIDDIVDSARTCMMTDFTQLESFSGAHYKPKGLEPGWWGINASMHPLNPGWQRAPDGAPEAQWYMDHWVINEFVYAGRIDWRHPGYSANFLFVDGHVDTLHWSDTAGYAGCDGMHAFDIPGPSWTYPFNVFAEPRMQVRGYLAVPHGVGKLTAWSAEGQEILEGIDSSSASGLVQPWLYTLGAGWE